MRGDSFFSLYRLAEGLLGNYSKLLLINRYTFKTPMKGTCSATLCRDSGDGSSRMCCGQVGKHQFNTALTHYKPFLDGPQTQLNLSTDREIFLCHSNVSSVLMKMQRGICETLTFPSLEKTDAFSVIPDIRSILNTSYKTSIQDNYLPTTCIAPNLLTKLSSLSVKPAWALWPSSSAPRRSSTVL